MQRQGQFQLEIMIARSPKDILAQISNYTNHPKIHPLIVSVKEMDAPAGAIRRYRITDQLPFGPFRFKMVYHADILRLTEHEIYTEAYTPPQTTVHNLTRVTPTEGGSLLQESLTLKTPSLLFDYAFKQAYKAHAEMLKRIKQFMENENKPHPNTPKGKK